MARRLALVGLLAVGACSVLRAGDGAPSGWVATLPGLGPAIRSCLRVAGSEAVGVTKAWPIGAQLAGVRVLAGDGARTDCIALAGGEQVILHEPVRQNSRLPHESEPLFTPAGREPPSGRCLRTRAARGIEGWVSYDVCAGAEAAVSAPRARLRQPSVSSS